MEVDPKVRGPLIFGATAVVSVGIGFLAAKWWTDRQTAKIIDDEIQAFKNDYKVVAEAQAEKQLDAKANAMAKDILAREGYGKPTVDTEDGHHVTAEDIENSIAEHSIFDDSGVRDMPEWDQEAEEASRDEDRPYIISKEEFFYTDEFNFTQMHITYYEEDDVLVDDENDYIPDIEGLVGEDNLLKFGYGSGDPNVLYIRNQNMQVDFEVTKNEGSFSKNVLGFIQHDDKSEIRRFRRDWD